MKKEKYSSIMQLINLPKKGYLPVNEIIFKKDQATGQEKIYVNEDIQKKRNQLIDTIEKQIQIFTDTNYKFKFPESKFPEVSPGLSNNIIYQKKLNYQDEDTFQNRLNPQQIQQIKQKGEFQVKSKMFNGTIPYVWRINPCLLRGYQGRVEIWQNGLAWCYNCFDFAIQTIKELVPMGFKELVYLPVKFFALIFGKKDLTQFYSPNFQREVYKDFWTGIMQNQLKQIKDEIGHDYLKILYLPYESAKYKEVDRTATGNERKRLQEKRDQKISLYDQKRGQIDNFKSSLTTIQDQFDKNWRKIRNKILAKISAENQDQNQKSMMIPNDQQPLAKKKKDTNIINRLYEQKFLLYTAHLKQHLPKKDLSIATIEALTTLILIFSLIQTKTKVKNDEIHNLYKKTQSQIEKKYRIRSKNYDLKHKMVKKIVDPINLVIQNDYYKDLISELEKKNYINDKFKNIFAKYINMQKNFQMLVQQKKKTLKSLYKPTRYFQSSYILFPPYQLLNNSGYYTLKKSVQMKIDTSTHFWKCLLYGMRFKCWNINCFKVLVGIFWASPLGFRCLCGVQDFVYDQYCNSSTGEKTQQKRSTIIGLFGKVLVGIKESRQAFEALPDLGLFGKNCSRICNYIQCYIFRLLIVGVIGLFMLYPIAIILFSILCLIGILTFWIWVPLSMLVCYLFNILIFQFEFSQYGEGCLIRGIPLLSLVIQIFIALFKIVAPFVFLLIIAPLVCFFYFLLLILQRVLRTITDTIMACLIGCLGRTPSRDTAIAKKISGPGMSRNYFYSISEQDVYVLTQAALQKIIISKFKQITIQQINGITKKYDVLTKYLLKPFGHQNPGFKSKVEQNKSQLRNFFDKKARQYQARYPKNPFNVRFTQQQIDLYFSNCTKIVKNFIQKYNIEWIFEQKGLLEGDYDEFTKYIWREIFNCGQEIFQPLEKIDYRFKLVDDTSSNSAEMKRNVSKIMKAVQGEVQLSRQKVTFSAAKRPIMQSDIQFTYIHQINDQQNNMREIYLNFIISDVKSIFIAPRNLEELKEYDRYIKETSREGQQKVIQI